MNFNPGKPYDLPLLPPKECEIETKEILKKCILARGLLGELKEIGKRIPNQSVLINTIPLLEAQGSSEIENIVTTADKLFRFSNFEDKADSATKEALQYRTALKTGFDLIKKKPITTNLAEEICSILKGTNMTVRKVPGIKLANPATKEVIYTPPEGESLLRNKLKNWEFFLNTQEDIDPLIRMAMMHYQFEAIHPFTDGNGRTGRVLNILYLIQENLLEIPVLYLSRFITQNKSDYYKKLLRVTTNNEWQNWILYMLEAVIETTKWTKEKIEQIEFLLQETKSIIKEQLPKIYSYELAELIFVQPYCRIQNL
ncbi:MAG: Fic/DOC family N-terminal domain-containing protein, partial [bacterium]